MANKASRLQPATRVISVFVAYGDCASASLALAALSAQWQRRGQRVALRPMMWPFRQLHDPRWRELAAHDALRAEGVLLALESAAALDGQLEGWIDTLRQRVGETALSLIMSVPGEEMWTLTISGRPHRQESVKASTSPKSAVTREAEATAA